MYSWLLIIEMLFWVPTTPEIHRNRSLRKEVKLNLDETSERTSIRHLKLFLKDTCYNYKRNLSNTFS